MEGLQNWFRSFSNNTRSVSPSNFPAIPYILRNDYFSFCFSIDSSRALAIRPPRQVVSVWTCSKFCAICCVAGIVVGCTLKPRVRGWASELLKRLKED